MQKVIGETTFSFTSGTLFHYGIRYDVFSKEDISTLESVP